MKNKFLYVTTGLLTIVVISTMFFSPQLYFAYEDWADHNITTTEEANLNNRNRNLTIAKKLELYAQYTVQQQEIWNPGSANEIYLSDTFIPYGNEISVSSLSSHLERELWTLASYFDQTQMAHFVLADVAEKFSFSEASATDYELVSLSEPPEGYILWEINYSNYDVTCDLIVDAVTCKIYSIDIIYEIYDNLEAMKLSNDNSLLIRNFFYFCTGYWSLPVDAQNTAYSSQQDTNILTCDCPAYWLTGEMEYTHTSYEYRLSIKATSLGTSETDLS